MGQDEVDIPLGQIVERRTLGKDRTKEYVVAFDVRFLVRGHWVAIEDAASAMTTWCKFNGRWIRELRTVVRQKHRERLFKILSAQTIIEDAEIIRNRSGGIVVSPKGQH